MQIVTLDGLGTGRLRATVDPETRARGLRLARRGGVGHLNWVGEHAMLWAAVAGRGNRTHSVLVQLVRGGSGEADLEFRSGECDCPVAFDCEHAAAAVFAAAASEDGERSSAPGTWEQDLDALVAGEPGEGAADGVPLALQLTLTPPPPGAGRYGPPPRMRLLARLVRPGRSGWVSGKLSWSRLATPWTLGEHPPDQLRLLRELHLLQHVPGQVPYAAWDDRTIDLAACDSPRLWSLLAEADAAGVRLVNARAAAGPVERVDAEIRLDVTAGQAPGSLTIAPRLSVDALPDAVPVLFVGASGHGVVLVSAADRDREPDAAHWPLRLARLAVPAAAPVQRMAIENRTLTVPAGEQDRFARVHYPKLRRLGPIGSSDGAFVPPAISGPTLVLRATFGDEHYVALAWEWSYDIAGEPVRAGIGSPGTEEAFRDPEQEAGVLARSEGALSGLRPAGDPTGAIPARLTGLDTMRFVREVLPLLRDADDVRVEVTGTPTDYREVGDSLRIGVSTGAVRDETDWFDLGITISVEGREIPFAPLFGALAAEQDHLLLPDGAWFSLLKPELQALRALIAEARELQDRPSDALRISRFQAGLWEELAALGVVERQARAWKEQVSGLLGEFDASGTPLPAGLDARLRPYQAEGFAWLTFLWRHRLGGILADDMGLGKTLQTLALIQHAREHDPYAPPFLIVAPTSVIGTWASEAARFVPGLDVVTLTDTLGRRGRRLEDAVTGADVVVTSYTLFRLDADAHAVAEWSGLVLDEAQFAKNHRSKVHQCARMLPAPFKLAITGTPMENNLMELWSLLSITAPGLFPHPDRFKDSYVRPIERGRDTELLARLRRRIRPLIRRRTKEQVASDLPPKQVQRQEIDLDPAHRRIYQRQLQRERQKVLGLIADLDRNRFTILRSLTLLRQLSLHPGLVDPEHDGMDSAKIEALAGQLTEVIAGGHRALVFSQFTRFLGRVRDRLDAEGIAYAYLDGSTTNRTEVVRSFTGGTAPVFLISLKAGGFGLNLTEADYCFLLDPWWNPAAEAQAVDRAHRIGQTRSVMVYRMIARDTIEEKVAALADRKAELFRGVLDEGDLFASALDADDIRALLE